MDNTREKLIELIQSAVGGCATYWAGLIADHLIANGVTLREHDCHWATEQAYKNGFEAGKPKWIPVTERLPEYEMEVLTYRGEGGISVERMFPGAFWDLDYDIIDPVTHWMPLPEPPKGE